MLEKVIDICCASEITSRQVKAVTEEVEVNRIRTVRPKNNKVKASTGNHEEDESSSSRCGFKHGTKKCPAIGQTCKSCHKKKIILPSCVDHRVSSTNMEKKCKQLSKVRVKMIFSSAPSKQSMKNTSG